MPATLQTAVAAASETGPVRRTNQDSWSYSLEAGLFAVCDGMGGPAGGEIASQSASEAFLEHLTALPSEQRSNRVMKEAVNAANRRVHSRAAQERPLRGMGTTLVALVARGEREVAVVHVGDSRCYLLRAGTLVRCTEDHSLVAEQLRMGVITEEQAARSPLRHVITRAVGTRRSVAPDVRTLEVKAGDVFLLCSDGLTRELPDAAIGVLLGRAGTVDERVSALMRAALRAGGRDNVTALLVEFA